MTAEDNKVIDVSPNKDGAILKELIREGSGDSPMPGDTVFVHYVGTLLDGEKFDSSRDRGEQFSFQCGKGMVIKGWDLGVPTMKRGEVAKFTIRGDYAYGKTGSPPKIAPDATLVFEIELFDFQGEDVSEAKDKSVFRRVIKEGSGYATPNDGSKLVLNLRGKETKSGRVFDERNDLEFELGDGGNHKVAECVEKALEKFRLGEKSVLSIKAHSAKECQAMFGVAAGEDVEYEVELKNFEKAKDSWQLNSGEKLEYSEQLKNKGAEFFKEGKYGLALKKYKKIIDFLQNEVYDSEEEKAKCSKILLASHLNVAACLLKTKEFKQVIESCSKALEIEETNEKGLFRMAQALFGMTEFQDALAYFNRVLEVNPSNKDAVNHIAMCKQKIKEYHEKEKALYAKMFAAVGK